MLSHEEARVLGCLIEKQATTPDAYPLTLNALTTACNQTTNRDPVVHYAAHAVEAAVLSLKTKGLARVVHPGSGERATKYRHIVDEALGLDGAERATIGTLLLRGAQTSGEIRSRAERLHPFTSVADVERVLDGLAARDEPLVVRLDPAAGQRDARWVQQLEDEPWVSGPSAPAPTRGSDLASRVDAVETRLADIEATLERLRQFLD
jgi:uncharacterized protein YceH (UPF0502 family)